MFTCNCTFLFIRSLAVSGRSVRMEQPVPGPWGTGSVQSLRDSWSRYSMFVLVKLVCITFSSFVTNASFFFHSLFCSKFSDLILFFAFQLQKPSSQLNLPSRPCPAPSERKVKSDLSLPWRIVISDPVGGWESNLFRILARKDTDFHLKENEKLRFILESLLSKYFRKKVKTITMLFEVDVFVYFLRVYLLLGSIRWKISPYIP